MISVYRNIKTLYEEAQNLEQKHAETEIPYDKNSYKKIVDRFVALNFAISNNSFFISYLVNCDFYKDFFILHHLAGCYSRNQYLKEQKKVNYNSSMDIIFSHLKERLFVVFEKNDRSGDYRDDPVLILKRLRMLEKRINNLPITKKITVF